jgi:hypothetical protein
MRTGQASERKNIHWSTRQTGQAGNHQNSSSNTTNTLDKESFKQALSQFLVDFFSSKHLDQGIDISTQLLSKPLDILTLLDLNIKKSYPGFYNLFKELHNDKNLPRLGSRINSNFKELRRLLHQTISDNKHKKLSNELAEFLTNLILTNNSQPENKNESKILSGFIHYINKTVNIDIDLNSVLLGLKLMFTKPHFLNDVMNSWQNFCESLNIDIDPTLKILSCILGRLSKKKPSLP